VIILGRGRTQLNELLRSRKSPRKKKDGDSLNRLGTGGQMAIEKGRINWREKTKRDARGKKSSVFGAIFQAVSISRGATGERGGGRDARPPRLLGVGQIKDPPLCDHKKKTFLTAGGEGGIRRLL